MGSPKLAAVAPAAAVTQSASLYAGLGQRFVGYLLDYVIFGVLAVIVIVVVWILLEKVANSVEVSAVNYLLDNRRLFSAALALILGWLYFAGLEGSRLQGTPGQRIMGIKVTNKAGAHVSLWRASARLIVKPVSVSFFMVGYGMALFTAKRQTLHDLIAGCLVVKAAATPETIKAAGRAPRTSSVIRIPALVAALVFPLMFIMAIVVPEYNHYVDRSGVSAAAQAAFKVQTALGAYFTKNNEFPSDLGTLEAASVTSRHIQRMLWDASTRDLRVTLASQRLQSKTIRLHAAVVDQNLLWTCDASDLPPRIRSAACDATNRALFEKFLK
jgi:uncharacterized RDD family membrane protein YckC/Tfp pilus assembly protein PilE